MSISVTCLCGKVYAVDESLIGKRVKCKACKATLTVQAPAAANPPGPTAAARPAASARPQDTRFFLAHLNSALGGSQLYRAYIDPDAVHFVHVGPYAALVDIELARRLDESHWAVKTADTVKTWMVAAAGAGGMAIGVLGLALSRAAFREPSQALELVSFLIAGILVLAAIAIFAVGSSIWRITRRVRQLEAMTPQQVRQEAVKEKSGLQAAAASVADVKIEKVGDAGGIGAKPVARLSFKHQPSGVWKLNLYTEGDAELAAEAFRNLVGRDKVAVDAALV